MAIRLLHPLRTNSSFAPAPGLAGPVIRLHPVFPGNAIRLGVEASPLCNWPIFVFARDEPACCFMAVKEADPGPGRRSGRRTPLAFDARWCCQSWRGDWDRRAYQECESSKQLDRVHSHLSDPQIINGPFRSGTIRSIDMVIKPAANRRP